MKPGDIIGFSSHDVVGVVINVATFGVPFWSTSHVGIIGEHAGDLWLYESVEANGVRRVKLDSRIEGYAGKVWHYPLYRPLYEFEQSRMMAFLDASIGLTYDFIGAIRSGGLGYSLIESMLRRADLSSFFCSELCCAAHAITGLFPTGHYSRWSPNRLVRSERAHGILQRPTRLK